MATKKKEYVSEAVTTKIQATSRISLKVNDTFYTLEYSEERSIPEVYDKNGKSRIDIEQERKLLWDTVNTEVDNQALDIQKMYKK